MNGRQKEEGDRSVSGKERKNFSLETSGHEINLTALVFAVPVIIHNRSKTPAAVSIALNVLQEIISVSAKQISWQKLVCFVYNEVDQISEKSRPFTSF